MTDAVNIKLIERVLHRIALDPSAWDQAMWVRESACGTTMCFAGWTVAIGDPASRFDNWMPNSFLALGETISARASGGVVTGAGVRAGIADYAAELLGVPKDVIGRLFYFFPEGSTFEERYAELRARVDDMLDDLGLPALATQADLDLAGGPR